MGIVKKVIGGFVLLMGVIVGGVFLFTADIVQIADGFFKDASQGQMDQAYAGLSQGFKASTNQEQLQQFLKVTALSDFKEASWTSRSIESGRGRLGGVVTTNSGQAIPLSVDFVKEEGEWKILGIERTVPGVKKENLTPPSQAELVNLARNSLAAFGQGVAQKDMRSFRDYIAELWRSQYSVERLNEAYSPLFAVETNWQALSQIPPIFDGEATINKDGVLAVSGYLPTRPDRLTFGYKYVLEKDDWKLIGLSINFKPAQ